MRSWAINKIPRRNIINRLKGNGDESVRKPGYQQVFTEREEAVFEKYVVGMCNFGFPLTTLYLRMVVHTYLSKSGRTVTRLKNNVPGQEWELSFLKRHPQLIGSRLASNIKQSRASVDRYSKRIYYKLFFFNS